MQSVEEFNDVTSSYFTDCVSLKGLFLPNCKNLPNISWSANMQGAMNLGKKAQLTYILHQGQKKYTQAKASLLCTNVQSLKRLF